MTGSVILDIVLVAVLLAQAVSGWRAGALAGGLGLVGLVAGAVLALWGAPLVLSRISSVDRDSWLGSLLLLITVLVAAVVGHGLLWRLGRWLRGTTHTSPLRVLDSSVGAVGAVVVLAMVMWFVAVGVQPVLPPSWARVVSGSKVLTTIDGVVPDQVGGYASRLTRVLDDSGFPRVFAGLAPEQIRPVPPPDPDAAQSAAVRRAGDSVVKIHAVASACRQLQEGSGWVSAPHRVVTNAHVVAGSTRITVRQHGTTQERVATVVAFDPDLDLAILAVPGLEAAPLPTAGRLADGTSVVAAGFPLDGPYRATPARVRVEQRALGEDIYGGAGVVRTIYSLYADIEPGNSGGPLLTEQGRVAGTVFARSRVDPRTGYALTTAQTAAMVRRGAGDTTPASTGACIPG